ncbi:hypothetical protein [Flavobacterium chungangensis]|uniref:Uncharacterized protein n=1 Tax=Flavobacterium chungangensis TaxID=2708132 RepID=A0ABV8ZES1_9FLAO
MFKWSEIAENASSQGHKANVVKPLSGMAIILLLGSGGLYYVGSYLFANIIGGLAVLIIIAFLVSYFFCLFKNPDLLRSEKYNLEKTAIEKIALVGDSRTSTSINAPEMDYVTVETTIVSNNEQE